MAAITPTIPSLEHLTIAEVLYCLDCDAPTPCRCFLPDEDPVWHALDEDGRIIHTFCDMSLPTMVEFIEENADLYFW